MVPQKIQIKLFANADIEQFDFEAVIPVFHRWIQEEAVAGLLIDVADYKHVPEGPGVMLVGHEVDYMLDIRDGRLGLQVSRKVNRTPMDKPLDEEIAIALRWALQSAELLDAEETINVTFSRDEIELRFVDALRTPNNDATYAVVHPTIAQVFADNLGSQVAVERVALDERRPLTVRVLKVAVPA